jgi:hypothetical protein
MNIWGPWLADVDLSQINPTWRRAPAISRETALVIVSTVGVGLLALLWAAFLRKRHRGRPKRHHSHHKPAPVVSPVKTEASAAVQSGRRHRRHRERRREHRPLNPTLSQTGGLPPIRSEGPGDSVP